MQKSIVSVTPTQLRAIKSELKRQIKAEPVFGNWLNAHVFDSAGHVLVGMPLKIILKSIIARTNDAAIKMLYNRVNDMLKNE